MSLKYEVRSKQSHFSKDKTPLYYPVLTGREVADIKMVAHEIHAGSTLSKSDIVAVVEALTDVIPDLMARGYNVKLNNLGTFSVHAKSQGQKDPDKVTVRDIKSLKMSFLPSKGIKEQLKQLKIRKKSSRDIN